MEFLTNLQTWSTTIIGQLTILILVAGVGVSILIGIKGVCETEGQKLAYRIIRAIFITLFAAFVVNFIGTSIINICTSVITAVTKLFTALIHCTWLMTGLLCIVAAIIFYFFVIDGYDYEILAAIIDVIIVFVGFWGIYGNILIAIIAAAVAVILGFILYQTADYIF